MRISAKPWSVLSPAEHDDDRSEDGRRCHRRPRGSEPVGRHAERVNPANPNLIAFAGQPVSGSTYNQDTNYIYVMDTSSSEGPSLREIGRRLAPDHQCELPGPGYRGGRRTGSGWRVRCPIGRHNTKRTASTLFTYTNTSAPAGDPDHQHDLQLHHAKMVSERLRDPLRLPADRMDRLPVRLRALRPVLARPHPTRDYVRAWGRKLRYFRG